MNQIIPKNKSSPSKNWPFTTTELRYDFQCLRCHFWDPSTSAIEVNTPVRSLSPLSSQTCTSGTSEAHLSGFSAIFPTKKKGIWNKKRIHPTQGDLKRLTRSTSSCAAIAWSNFQLFWKVVILLEGRPPLHNWGHHPWPCWKHLEAPLPRKKQKKNKNPGIGWFFRIFPGPMRWGNTGNFDGNFSALAIKNSHSFSVGINLNNWFLLKIFRFPCASWIASARR